MDHLFQRIGQHKEKVILGFAYATCDVIATNYLTSGTYPVGDNYFAAIRQKIVESLLDYPSAEELATAKTALLAAAKMSGWSHDDCCFAENATPVGGNAPENHWRATELLDENVFLSGGLRGIITPAKVATVARRMTCWS